MSHAATAWAIKQKGLKPATKIVLWTLADCHNPANGCFPTQAYLADACEMSRSTVNLHLDLLVAKGLIRREAEIDPRTKRQLPTQYHLAMDAVSEIRTQAVSENETRAVSEKPAEPCPKNEESRVRNPDTNLVREPVTEPVREIGRKRRAPELPLPDDWVPSDRNISDAVARSFSQQEIDDEADRFRNHHIAKGNLMRSWDAAWLTWLGNARRYANGGVARPTFTGRGIQGRSLASIAAQRRASDAY